MGQAESRLAFKNKVFILAGTPEDGDKGISQPIPSDDSFWNLFWEQPTCAEDVFSLLTYTDIRNIRTANKTNFLNLIRVVTVKLIKLARDKNFPNRTTASAKHLLNCVRVLTRMFPFLFEMAEWEKEINHLFWNIALNSLGEGYGAQTNQATVGSFSTDPLSFVSLQTNTVKVNIDVDLRKSPSSLKAEVGRGAAGKPLGQELMDVLIDLLFTREFTLVSSGVKGPDYATWESGIGQPGKYMTPDPELDSNRLEVLRLIITVVSQGLYKTPKTAVAAGSRFLTTLVATTTPRHKLITLICSTLNVVCRSCKPDSENNGLTYSSPANNHQYSHQKFYELRKTFVGFSLQLLALMVVYPLPQGELQFLYDVGMMPPNERPHNMVRSALGKLHKENELNFIYSSFISLLLRPMQQAADNEANPFNLLKNISASPASPSGVQNAFGGGLPQLSQWTTEIVVLMWELIQCNKYFKNFVYSKKIQELAVTTFYYIKFYRNDPLWRLSLVRVMCYFMLYLTSDELAASKLLSPFSTNYYTNMLPNFYKLNSQSLPSNLSYRDFLVVQISTMLSTEEFDMLMTPSLFNYLYNLIPVKNIDPNIKTKMALSYSTCVSVLNVIREYSKEDTLRNPLKMDLLALLVRAIAHSICRYHKESRTLLFLLTRHEKVMTGLLQAITIVNIEDSLDDSIAPDQSVPTTAINTPANVSPEPASPSEPNSALDISDSDILEEDYELSLRPSPPTGMSSKAKSKLPVDAPLIKTWAGYRALAVILRSIKLINHEIPILGEGSRSEVVETLIRIENIPDFQRKVAKFTNSEFLPKTKLERLEFNWSTISLGWYESILWGVIVYQNINMARESASSNWYKRSSAISLKDVASTWGFNWKAGAKAAEVELFNFDSTILQLNIWNGSDIKLFKMKTPIPEKPLVDMTNLMKRFRLNSAASINTVDTRISGRQNSNSGLNSPNQLTPINSRQSFGTPRNSISAAGNNRDSIHSLSRQNSYNNF